MMRRCASGARYLIAEAVGQLTNGCIAGRLGRRCELCLATQERKIELGKLADLMPRFGCPFRCGSCCTGALRMTGQSKLQQRPDGYRAVLRRVKNNCDLGFQEIAPSIEEGS